MKVTSAVLGATVGLGMAVAACSASAGTFVVSYEGEAPGVQNTTATFSQSGVETFDNRTSGTSFTSNFGRKDSAIQGAYSGANGKGVQINSADQYGGADGTGKYIVAFNNTPYSLTLTSSIAGGVNYFGYWLSALDAGNIATFYGDKGQVLFTFNPKDVLDAVKTAPNPSQYYGNPNSNCPGCDSNEPFMFINFFDTTGSFSKIVFSEDPSYGGGYESDNHTVGHYLTMGEGTVIPLVYSTSTPEPSTFAMMILGFASLGFAAFHGRRKAANQL